MSLNTIFDESYHRVDILLKQQSTARLPYYGPVVRGWLRDALHQDEYLWKVSIMPGKIGSKDIEKGIIVELIKSNIIKIDSTKLNT